ncbi:efflux RND transporter periplasmic adaptor subunit [Aureibacter tunicatorum]|uniref:RND family efflux transporter MFP subunit n=1 Tax=Aureibacter tunicatorum TaxID=866807 RepID=A0AAE3XQV5_9BACT|nr:efflux RND transporter periplasmic adaptor subunit [Aureibacter tunicatorum]MDR6240995.1 RND family efflux transporter MFP subunit [Aureibacter tunicatorum]BDD03774.1 RND transporter [Aureibacter tunicatorum]
MKINTILIALSISGLTMACGSSSQEKSVQNIPSVKAEVITLSSELVPEQSKYSAKIESGQSIKLSTKLMGRIVKMNVDEGELVKKGQLLAVIDSEDLNAKKSQAHAAMKQAKAAFENASKDYERFQKLYEKKSASEKELEDMKTRWLASKAQLEAAEQMESEVNQYLKYSRLKAPYDGIVAKKFMDAGDLASPGMPILAISSDQNFEALAKVSEKDLSKFQQGNNVYVEIPSVKKVIEGKVKHVNYSNQYSGAQYLVTVDLNGSDNSILRSGMQAYVMMNDKASQKLMIPESAIVRKGQMEGVFIVSENNKAQLRWLRLGRKKGGKVEVISGLRSGEKIVESPSVKIKDGTPLSF